ADTCGVAYLGTSSVNVAMECGRTYDLYVSGSACSVQRPITASFNSLPAGYILEFEDTSNNSVFDNKTSVVITFIQAKTWKVSLKPKRVHFTADSLSPDGRSQVQAKLNFLNGASGNYFTGNPTWTIQGDNLGCTIDSTTGWIRAGTEIGEITVRATDSGTGNKFERFAAD